MRREVNHKRNQVKNTISEKKNLGYGMNRLGIEEERINELEDTGI